ncbi:MAG: F0F1 ATP synthase subunit B [Veillonella sp.]|nr:F0F1 ATP synthase subunit B [Veillonella sp.]MCF0155751.1 F0F1 ATP synthase subunit B [Veillonella sp.]
MVDITGGTILAQIINFLILLFILAKFAYKPLCNMMDERRQRIANDLSAAENAKLEAQNLRQSYESQLQAARKEAQEIVEKAVQEAKAVSAQQLSDLRTQLQAERDKARREIEEERAQAMKSLREDIVTMSVAMAGKVVEQDMNSEANAKLIEDAIERLNSKTMGL